MTAKRSYYAGKRWGVRTVHAKHGPLFEVYEPFAPAGEDHRVICATFERARELADFYNSDDQ